MADTKISALPASTTPLAGTEVLPIVQSGTTKKTSIESVLTSVQPSGTANGVTYLNGSKVLTSGSALTFDGTTLTNRVSANAALQLAFSATNATNADFNVRITNSLTDLQVSSATPLSFTLGVTEQMRLTSTGLGIGTSSIVYGASGRGVLNLGGSASGLIGFQIGGAAKGYIAHFDSNMQIWNEVNSPILFGVNAAEQMRLTSTGLGIGTSSPERKLHIAAANPTNGNMAFVQNTSTSSQTGALLSFDVGNVGTSAVGIPGGAANALAFYVGGVTSGSEAMRLDSSGNLGLGVTPSAWSGLKAFEFAGVGSSLASAANNNVFLSANAWYNGANWRYGISAAATQYQSFSGAHVWSTAPSGTAGNAISFTQAMTLDASGNLVVGGTTASAKIHGIASSVGGTTYALMTDNASGGAGVNVAGIAFANSGAIKSSITSAVYGNDYIAFNVGGSGTTERARIDASGNLLVGITTSVATPANGLCTQNTTGATQLNIGHGNGTGSGTAYLSFAYNAGTIGSITQSGTTAVLYNVTSDQRLKENIQDAAPASALIDSIKVRQYDWKADGTHQRYGFVAQELVTVAPEAVYQPVNPDDMMAVDYSKLVPMLVKEIQSLRQRLAAAGI
jgi:hypothetical protein